MSSSARTEAMIQIDGTSGWVRLAVVVALCVVLAAALARLSGFGSWSDTLLAGVRASLQLVLVGLVIAWVLSRWSTTLAFVALMLGVAGLTASRRITKRSTAWALIPVAAAALPVSALLVLSGLVTPHPISVIPVAGILIGNAMTTTVLAGRRVNDALKTRNDEWEGWLALGAPMREATLAVAREDAGLALMPGIDTTKTVGLVTLPGAFVGMLLGGATPLDAAGVQLVVLAALLLVNVIAAWITLELVARRRLLAPVPGR